MSVREVAGYDEVYPSEHEPDECFPRSLKWELSIHLLSKEGEDEEDEEGYEENDEGDISEKEEESEEDEEDEGNQSNGVELVGQADRGAHLFILPSI